MVESSSPTLWVQTPLIYSSHISRILGCSAYLKLEGLQPSQSFKYRGISLFAQRCKALRGPSAHLIIASSGNAALAAARAARELDLKCTVFLPDDVTQATQDFLRKEGANIVVWGKYYLQAYRKAEEAVKDDPNAVMVSSYDDPIVWEGHSSMIQEIQAELPCKPDAIFCSVGGGGLLGGVIAGCRDVGWDDVTIVGMETEGSNCFHRSMGVNTKGFTVKYSPDSASSAVSIDPTHVTPNALYDVVHDVQHSVALAHLRNITSRAASLGATSPAAGVVKMALTRSGQVKCVSVPDDMSMSAGVCFAEDHKMLTELACSTTLTAAYNLALFSHLLSPAGTEAMAQNGRKNNTVVFIVCGGLKISLKEMEDYRASAAAAAETEHSWKVLCDDRWIVCPKRIE